MKIPLLKFTYCIAIVMLLVSCKSKTKIEINFDASQKGLLVFDENDTIKLVGDTTLIYETTVGKHTFILNKQKQQTFFASRTGGLLNLNKKRYIRFYERYQDENQSPLEAMASKRQLNYFQNDIVAIDSLVYIYKQDSTAVISDEQIKASLKAYEQNIESKANLKLYNADLFIERDWDYGLTEDFPETISVTSNSSFFNSEIRTKILDLNFFKLMAMLTPQNFVIKSKKDILKNVEDKKVDQEKKKNQLDF
jgi:hypothetical protein